MNIQTNRRGFLAGTGALVVSVALPGVSLAAVPAPLDKRPALDPSKLASYLSVNADGSINAYVGKLDMGDARQMLLQAARDVPLHDLHVVDVVLDEVVVRTDVRDDLCGLLGAVEEEAG